jgi:hypothetical protein
MGLRALDRGPSGKRIGERFRKRTGLHLKLNVARLNQATFSDRKRGAVVLPYGDQLPEGGLWPRGR